MTQSAGGAERRLFTRLSKSLTVYYKVIKNAKSPDPVKDAIEMRAGTKDISAGGLAFYIREKIPLYSILEIRMSLPGRTEPVTCLAEVVRSRLVENTPFCDIALCFLDLSNKDRVLVDKFVHQEAK
jgi:c-di-GMP-binding flagellar brake protein YcgR